MSRDGYSPRDNYSPRSSQRWDAERFTVERDRERDRYDDRYSEVDRDVRYRSGGGYGRPRERSLDRIYERRGPRASFEDDHFQERIYYDDDPRLDRDRIRREAVTIEKERISSPSPPPPPRRGPYPRPGLIRRQSSLDTFDRQPLSRIIRERDEERYGPPARREELRPPPLNPVRVPRDRRDLRRFEERDYEEIKISDPDYYGDDLYRPYPERIREKEIIKTRNRSRRRSVSSSSSDSDRETVRSVRSTKSVRSEYPKRGKTRIPGKLVSKKAIIDLGYPFEEDGTTIVILKALGREHIDQVIQLSEVYKSSEKKKEKKEKVTTETQLTTYVVTPEDHHHHRHHHDDSSSASSETFIEERREVYTIPPRTNLEIIRDKEVVDRRHSRSPGRRHHHHHNAIIVDAGKPRDFDRSDPIPVGPLALAVPERSRRDEHAIRAEIRALEAEKDALRAEKRMDEEIRRASYIRKGHSDDLVVYEKDRYVDDDEVLIVKKEKIVEPEGGVRIEKDRKGKMSISVPKYLYR